MHQPTAGATPVDSGSEQAEQSAHAFGSASQVTFLFTDIEGSTALWERDEARMSQALALHDALARSAVESHGGNVVKTTGDGIHAAFDDASAALAATLELQLALQESAVSGVHRCACAAACIEASSSIGPAIITGAPSTARRGS